MAASASESSATGDAVVALALTRVGESYVLGARAPMANSGWHGPWDCAEFASWCVYQSSGVLYGTQPRRDPMLADAYTGFWSEQAIADGATIPVEQAAAIPGALVLRAPGASGTGHIVISTGDGGTVEAHSSARGVIEHELRSRRWDTGILVPGVRYFQSTTPVVLGKPATVLHVTRPLTRGPAVLQLQEALTKRGYAPGSIDGIYGPQTADAVRAFQHDVGLVPDGEAGPLTMRALRSRPT